MTPSKQLASFLRVRDHLLKTRVHTSTARNANVHPSLTRAMASDASSNISNPQVGSESTSGQQTSQTQQTCSGSTQDAPLPLPEPTSDATQLNVNGEGVKLDHLGPLVVNKDGTLSRIANWDKMAEVEKQNTLRILGKRNQLRLGNLRGEGKEDGK